MIVLLTDSEVMKAADTGAKKFMSKYFHSTRRESAQDAYHSNWFESAQDVYQEGRLLAIDFMRRYDNPKRLNPVIISQRVYFGLIDLVRRRSKCRTLNPAPRFFSDSDLEYVRETVETQYLPDWRDALETLIDRLTFKEALTLELFKQGFSQAQIARELGVSRSCVAKRFVKIRRKLATVLDESYR